MKFSDVVGLDETKNQLITSVKNNKLPQALMFISNEGTGGLPLALAFTQYINCENKINDTKGLTGDSCGECPSCKKMKKLIHPDVHFSYPVIKKEVNEPPVSIDFINEWRNAINEEPYITYFEWLGRMNAGNKQGNITIKECHDIIKKLSLKAYEGGKKILIMWLPEFLGKNGNALLKIIEEPSPNTLFIFISHNQNLILNTIISRTQVISLPPLTIQSIANKLVTVSEISIDEANKVAQLANGNYSEALRIYKSGESDHSEEFMNWMRLCYIYEALKLYKWMETISSKGREHIKDFLKYGIRMIRESLLLSNQLKEITHINKSEEEFALKFSAYINENNSPLIYELLNQAHHHIERNANPKIIFFNLSLQFHKLLKKNNQT